MARPSFITSHVHASKLLERKSLVKARINVPSKHWQSQQYTWDKLLVSVQRRGLEVSFIYFISTKNLNKLFQIPETLKALVVSSTRKSPRELSQV